MTNHIPNELLVDIARFAGHRGFRNLRPYVAMGKTGKNAAFAPQVLKEVNLEDFLQETHMVNLETEYRPFFKRCIDHGNPTAIYLEGLRIAVKEGPGNHALCMLCDVADRIPHAQFAAAIFMMCEGNFKEGKVAMQKFFTQTGHLEKAVDIADAFINHLLRIGATPEGHYNFNFNYDEFPLCVFNGCQMRHCCFDCMPFWYSLAVMAAF